MHWACLQGSSELIIAILDGGFKRNQNPKETKKYSTPLQLAARSGNIKTIPVLLKRGFNIHEKDCVSDFLI